MAGALDGVTVLEVADYVTGPYAGMLLADLGAHVIKIEKQPSGDPFRGFDPAHGGGYDAEFLALNRNKQSMMLDLASASGREIFLKLADRATVVVENHRPGVMAKWGVDYDTVSKRNPGIVYCSISGFGQDGPYRDLPGYDTLGVAMGGLLSILTDMEAPEAPRITFADHLTGIFASHAVLAALYCRAQTGKGQMVETSLLQSVTSFIQSHAARYFLSGRLPKEHKRSNLAAAFVAGDGKPFVIHLSTPPKFWEGLTAAVGRPELRDVNLVVLRKALEPLLQRHRVAVRAVPDDGRRVGRIRDLAEQLLRLVSFALGLSDELLDAAILALRHQARVALVHEGHVLLVRQALLNTQRFTEHGLEEPVACRQVREQVLVCPALQWRQQRPVLGQELARRARDFSAPLAQLLRLRLHPCDERPCGHSICTFTSSPSTLTG